MGRAAIVLRGPKTKRNKIFSQNRPKLFLNFLPSIPAIAALVRVKRLVLK
jgi:hypothetical protein